jgi:hypothetical protein
MPGSLMAIVHWGVLLIRDASFTAAAAAAAAAVIAKAVTILSQ